MMNDDGIVGRRVLVVEDDYLLAVDLAALLKRAGARVIGPVAKVADAIAAIAHQPEAAILDFRLGDETSVEVAEALTQGGVPFLFATGSTDEIPNAHRAFAIFTKPIGNAALLRALAEALRPGSMAGA